MNLIKRILKVFGYCQENPEEQLMREMGMLRSLQIKSLDPNVTVDEISPAIVLGHIDNIKNILKELDRQGYIGKTVPIQYTLNNIEMEKNHINVMSPSYTNNLSLYLSHVGAIIGVILEDLALFLRR